MSQPSPIRLAVLDADTGFLQVLSKRLEGAGWQYRVLASPVPLDAIVAMRLNAIVLDLEVLGPQGWNYLEKLCARLPGPGGRRLHRPVLRRPARARAAARRRRLDDQAVPPGGADRARRGGRAAAQARRGARRLRPRGRGRGRDPRRPVPGLRRGRVRRPHAARVRADPAAGGRQRAGHAARGDLPAGLGLRDGPRRPLGRRLRPQAAPEAREGLARLALHPHPLRDRVPVRAGARRGRGHRGRARRRARADRVGRGAGGRSQRRRSYRSGSWAPTATA